MAVICLSLFSFHSGFAQVQRSFVNPGFELPNITLAPYSSATYIQTDAGNVPGWLTSASDNKIELWRSGFNGVPSHSGSQHAELNATQPSKLSQSVCVLSGENFNWSFWHRGRSGIDTCRILIGNIEQGRFATGTSGWNNFTGGYLVPADGILAFEFEAVYAAGGLSIGNFLDDVSVVPPLKPFVMFSNGTFSDNEASGGNLPTLYIVGEVKVPQTIDLTITGGTATNGVDYTYVTTVNIPVGDYDGTSGTAITIGLTIIDDGISEINETIEFLLTNPSSDLIIGNTQTCGEPVVSTTIYTIMDDEPLGVGDAELSATLNESLKSFDLNWSIQQASQFSGIEIQHSGNGVNFNSVFSLNDTTVGGIHLTDGTIYNSAGAHYFRLRLVEPSGKESFSNIVKIMRVISNGNFYLFPNPASELVYILWQGSVAPEELKIVVTNSHGLIVSESILPFIDSGHPLRYELPEGMSPGAYFFQVTDVRSGTSRMHVVMIGRNCVLRIAYCVLRIAYRVLRIAIRISHIAYRISHIAYRISHIAYRVSRQERGVMHIVISDL